MIKVSSLQNICSMLSFQTMRSFSLLLIFLETRLIDRYSLDAHGYFMYEESLNQITEGLKS